MWSGLGHGTVGYGLQFEPRAAGPTVTQVSVEIYGKNRQLIMILLFGWRITWLTQAQPLRQQMMDCSSLTVYALLQQVFPGGEAFRTGLVQLGDVLVEVDGQPVKGRQFMEVMDSVVTTRVRDAAVLMTISDLHARFPLFLDVTQLFWHFSFFLRQYPIHRKTLQ